MAATITPQHLIINRNAIFDGGIRPHAYCLPIAKRERHRLAVRKAAVSGSPKFFLGTDSAPHMVGRKEAEEGKVAIRRLGSQAQTIVTIEEAIAMLTDEALAPDLKRARDGVEHNV